MTARWFAIVVVLGLVAPGCGGEDARDGDAAEGRETRARTGAPATAGETAQDEDVVTLTVEGMT